MSKEILEINSVYGEEDFKALIKKVINLKLNVQEPPNKKLSMDQCTDSGSSPLIGHR